MIEEGPIQKYRETKHQKTQMFAKTTYKCGVLGQSNWKQQHKCPENDGVCNSSQAGTFYQSVPNQNQKQQQKKQIKCTESTDKTNGKSTRKTTALQNQQNYFR